MSSDTATTSEPDTASRADGDDDSATHIHHPEVDACLEGLQQRVPHETEFLQAAREVLGTLGPVLDEQPDFARQNILERIVEPERVIQFRVPWLTDDDEVCVNRG